ncbi:hypothetical protein PGTUg99_011327 [Puccinia graminis f. sp. tritici]|uniref:Uncharacterized protein n=2 Tax=Puccinia graminis f. sp. tritici TaxID=56615 RepID=E3JY25_PUCGT|nr:uncharacterized protein PGTG_02411 [Puccinia graminis f. sp. tritici CRL 75-36-700-3]EFP76950.1 hypothetical protein PGTG_02411 [Puccinia graminis f. sp. tritici CRL 75-36-700-3]KAA1135326.1 hypothetical protein PGTUg99_011327 [Puccinia graminis f. sp. tritici]
MVNFPNALQPPPSGITLPDRFVPLTQPTGGSGGNTAASVPAAPARTTGANDTSASGTPSSAVSAADNNNSSSASSLSATSPDVSAINVALPASNNTLLVDPNSSVSQDPAATNVGQHVLNNQGEVDGSAIGLGKTEQNPNALIDADNQGLSPGAKAGAIAGTLVTFFILVAIAFVARKLHRSKAHQRQVERHSTIIERQRSSSLTDHHSDCIIHPHAH